MVNLDAALAVVFAAIVHVAVVAAIVTPGEYDDRGIFCKIWPALVAQR